MAKPNYQFEKRQRDLKKRQKQEAKRQKKLAAKQDGTPEQPADSPDPAQPDALGDTPPADPPT